MAVAPLAEASEGATIGQQSVRRFFEAVRADDEAAYVGVAPELVLMFAVDAGAPLAFVDAKATFGECALLEVSREEALPAMEDFPARLSAVMSHVACPGEGGAREELKVEFLLADDRLAGVSIGDLPPVWKGRAKGG
ncbi:MAG: hypothetical protein QM608_21190 [Caulobacter sp.]